MQMLELSVDACMEQTSPQQELELLDRPMLQLIDTWKLKQNDFARTQWCLTQPKFVGKDRATYLLKRCDLRLSMRKHDGQRRMAGLLPQKPSHHTSFHQISRWVRLPHPVSQFLDSTSQGRL